MQELIHKFKEVLTSVLPITLLVLVLHFLVSPLETDLLLRFLVGAFLITVGLTLFLLGVDRGITPFSMRIGGKLIKSNRISVVAGVGLLLGFFISIAEPDLHILASQVDLVTGGQIGKWLIVSVVSVGIAVLIATGLIRSLFNYPLYKFLTILYGIILLLSIFSSPEFLAISFDASGATTGAMTVPFILALSISFASSKKDGKASEKDSFGLVAIASVGAILAMLITGLLTPRGDFAAAVDFSTHQETLIHRFLTEIIHQTREAALAIAPLFVILVLGQPFVLKFKPREFNRIARSFFLVLVGLTLLFAGVNAGFMEVARSIGMSLALRDNKIWLILFGFILGLLTILAEPAVHVLTQQIEEVTSGSVPRKAVLVALSLGVGTAVTLSLLRIMIPAFQLWHILLPGYLLSIFLAHVGSKLFVGIAFDSGGVASGPMTATFILAFTQGAANTVNSANIMVDGFGVISLVALTPIITLQLLGLLYRRKTISRKGISDGRLSD